MWLTRGSGAHILAYLFPISALHLTMFSLLPLHITMGEYTTIGGGAENGSCSGVRPSPEAVFVRAVYVYVAGLAHDEHPP